MRRRRNRPPSTGRSSFPARGLSARDTAATSRRLNHGLAAKVAMVGGVSDKADGWPAQSLAVVARNRRRRRLPQARIHLNSNCPNDYRLLSPKTRLATLSDRRRRAKSLTGFTGSRGSTGSVRERACLAWIPRAFSVDNRAATSLRAADACLDCAACAGCRLVVVGSGVDGGTTYCFWLRDHCVSCRKLLDSIPSNTEVAVARRERGAVRTL